MKVKVVEEGDDEPRHIGKIGLWVINEYSVDLSVDVEELLELRAEIDRFLFLRAVSHAIPLKGT